MQSVILDLHNKLISCKIKPKNLIKQSLKYCKKYQSTNFLLQNNKNEALRLSKHLGYKHNLSKYAILSCIPYVLKDNISTKGITTTGGSKFLKNYIPPYDATVYKLLKQNNAILIGKANMDEFGLGGTGSFSAYGIVHHPFSKLHIAGGSSSGSAVAVATKTVPFAIGTDTGDSIRRPASFCGIVGYKPTYGLISRYGVFPYAPSLDHVGVFTNTVVDAALVSDAIIDYDLNDFSSQKFDKKLFHELQNSIDTSSIKLGYPVQLETYMTQDIMSSWMRLKYTLKSANINLIPLDIDMELIHAINPVYKIISYAEAVSCYSSYTGIPFGTHMEGNSFEEIAGKARDELFGEQLKQRFIIGFFALKKENFEKYFLKAKLVRTKINNHLFDLLKKVDAIISLGSSTLAPLINDVLKNKYSFSNVIDDFLQLANFSGVPSITIPFAKNNQNLFLGLNITGNLFQDHLVLKIAEYIENLIFDRGMINV